MISAVRAALVVLLIAVWSGFAAPVRAATGLPPPCEHVSADPFGSTPCPGVRPGAVLMVAPELGDGSLARCTAGFLFKGRGEVYVATAGHCAEGADPSVRAKGEVRWSPGDGPEVWDANGERIGEFAYALLTKGNILVGDEDRGELPRDADLALIRLDRGVEFLPQMCHFGGPTGINSDLTAAPEPVTLHHFGATFVGGYVGADTWVLPARTAVATGMPDVHKVLAYGHASFADSGSPVISSDGRAVGVLSGPPDDLPQDGHAGTFVSTRLRPQLQRAEHVLGFEPRLLTAPLT